MTYHDSTAHYSPNEDAPNEDCFHDGHLTVNRDGIHETLAAVILCTGSEALAATGELFCTSDQLRVLADLLDDLNESENPHSYAKGPIRIPAARSDRLCLADGCTQPFAHTEAHGRTD